MLKGHARQSGNHKCNALLSLFFIFFYQKSVQVLLKGSGGKGILLCTRSGAFVYASQSSNELAESDCWIIWL